MALGEGAGDAPGSATVVMTGWQTWTRWSSSESSLITTAVRATRSSTVVPEAGGRRFDGGIDLKMVRDGEYTIVQCKRENALQVTHNVGHELLGILMTERADRAIVVNAGEFTPRAWATAAKNAQLELIDGNRLREMLGSVLDGLPEPEPE